MDTKQLTMVYYTADDEEAGQVSRVEAETFIQSAWLKRKDNMKIRKIRIFGLKGNMVKESK